MLPTAISHKNTSATSTAGLCGENNCTETREIQKLQTLSWIKEKKQKVTFLLITHVLQS